MTTRVLLADDQPGVRFGLRLLLDREPELEVVGEATDLDSLLAQLERHRPDLILLDWELPGLVMPEAMVSLRERFPQLKVVALSGRLEARQAALAANADAFVSKSNPPERLLAALNGICRRG